MDTHSQILSQVAEGIRRLREEVAFASTSGASTGQPPTPSTTPGPYYAAAVAVAAQPLQPLGIIPEHLAESINSLRRDEGLGRGFSLSHFYSVEQDMSDVQVFISAWIISRTTVL